MRGARPPERGSRAASVGVRWGGGVLVFGALPAPNDRSRTGTMTFWKLFKAKSCSLTLSGTTKDEVLVELVDALIEGGSIEADLRADVLKALRDREDLATTGVGQNVAIPHVKIGGLERAVASLSIHPAGVEWAAVDGEPVQVLFTVLRPAEEGPQYDPETHLEMMRWISRLSRERDFRSFALQATTRTQLVDLLKEMAGV